MSRAEWLRTFLAIYRSSSVTAAARQRNISQPAASQQLASLEATAGGPLFLRSKAGLEPTSLGRELYAEVAEALDRLEGVLVGLDAGMVRPPAAVVRFGSTAEFGSAVLVPRLGALEIPVRATFGSDSELIELLQRGDLDVTVTAVTPPKRTTVSFKVADRRFVLVAAPALLTGRSPSKKTLGPWLKKRPWVSYSSELPVTRRFWQSFVGETFAADLRFVAPDLRCVLAAVEAGMGVSLLPNFVCAEALAAGRVAEVLSVSDAIPAEPVFAAARPTELRRPEVAALLTVLSELDRTPGGALTSEMTGCAGYGVDDD